MVYARDDAGSSYSVYVREELRVGDEIHGPAVITEHTATTVMHASDALTIGRYGEMVIAVAAREEGTR